MLHILPLVRYDHAHELLQQRRVDLEVRRVALGDHAAPKQDLAHRRRIHRRQIVGQNVEQAAEHFPRQGLPHVTQRLHHVPHAKLVALCGLAGEKVRHELLHGRPVDLETHVARAHQHHRHRLGALQSFGLRQVSHQSLEQIFDEVVGHPVLHHAQSPDRIRDRVRGFRALVRPLDQLRDEPLHHSPLDAKCLQLFPLALVLLLMLVLLVMVRLVLLKVSAAHQNLADVHGEPVRGQLPREQVHQGVEFLARKLVSHMAQRPDGV
mmetsp:Transcript_5101/g.13035  ORF Transcript_5101/g.13035 Transcript_5101/m.13035 type:complete len:265 (+) Transcript_5101:493-1287(+)